MRDKNKKEIIADMNKKISQFQQWHIDYGSTGIKILDMRATIVNTLIESCESMMSEKNVDLDELDLEYQQLYSAISQLAKACKLKNVPSATPRGGGSSLPSQISDASFQAFSSLYDGGSGNNLAIILSNAHLRLMAVGRVE